MSARAAQLSIEAAGRRYDIEHLWLFAERRDAPLLIFLHEGLGSVAMWRDFPQQLCDRGGFRGLVYSRPGYGQSTPRATDERWPVDFMHHQALDVLPALLRAAGVENASAPIWLFGHSDGGSIALLHAAAYPEHVAGAIVLAPHLFVEDISVASIAKARDAYLHTDLRHKLSRYHADVDSAFWGWNDTWLDPAFRAFNIERDVAGIRCPVLAIQGVNDEYGSMAQIDRINALTPKTRLLKLTDCGHSPHRDQPEHVIRASLDFIQS